MRSYLIAAAFASMMILAFGGRHSFRDHYRRHPQHNDYYESVPAGSYSHGFYDPYDRHAYRNSHASLLGSVFQALDPYRAERHRRRYRPFSLY
ncbi:unnamed protein product [Darwinula stevensoni]|uniref:Uncharacterized protein n=1 Tax=Darwinula stevensoni TaxID=69355 RepID=A0A7R9A0Q5_9CRUS|nr:unnamed protein product [Darwinula stevensoni]CAG0886067.1 unnamed protein product [Darwinula stevensoni]